MATGATDATMKALRLVQKKAGMVLELSLTSVPKPKLIPKHLLVKVHASAIHPSDILNARGGFPLTTFPRIPGRDFADGFRAEYCLVHEKGVAQKPKNLSFVQAACIGVPFTTATLTLRRANTVPSDSVLVLGASGAVGSAVVRLAEAKGSRVLQASRSDRGDINTSKDPGLEAVTTLTQGQGVDVIVDTVGQPELTKAAIGKLAQGGRLVFIAAPRSGSTDLGIEMIKFYQEEKAVLGCNSLRYSVEEMAEEMAAITVLFDKGVLKPGGGNWTHVSLEDAAQAYEKAINKRTSEKFVVIME